MDKSFAFSSTTLPAVVPSPLQGGGEGVGGPCTVNPTHVHSLSVAHVMHSLVYCCEAPSEGHMEQPHTYGISCNRGCSSQILPFLVSSRATPSCVPQSRSALRNT